VHTLDNDHAVRNLDTKNMLSLVNDFPQHITHARAIGERATIPSHYFAEVNQIVFCGMGGSAIGADIIRCLCAHDISVPIVVNRDYGIPSLVNEKTLVIVSSYSGNTEETLAAFEASIQKRAKIIVISTNGKIGKRAHKAGIPLITIPQGLPPRQALAFLVFPLLVIFDKCFHTNTATLSINGVIALLQHLRDTKVGPSVSFEQNDAKQIAQQLYGTFPIIYTYNDYFAPVALRWRGQLEENAKTLCSHHVLPEMNHNEIMGWQEDNPILKQCRVVMLRSSFSNKQVSKRMDITASIIRDAGVEVITVAGEGEDIYSQIFSLLYIGDFVSVYLAILNGVNPYAIDKIDFLKKALAQEHEKK